MKTFLLIVGVITFSLIIIILIYKIYRIIFGYSYESCPNNHDDMSRYGSKGNCSKCGTEF